jgi:biopolymer transport protein ExbD
MDDEQIPKPNMTPMIDVVFQLLVFFLVSMKFKTLDMKIEAFLPKDRGLAATITKLEETPKIVAVLKRRSQGGVLEKSTRVKVQNQSIGTSDKADTWTVLTTKAKAILDRHIANAGDPADVKGEVDASALVPTGDVVRAVDAFIAAGLQDVTFVGTPPPGSTLDKVREQAGVR